MTRRHPDVILTVLCPLVVAAAGLRGLARPAEPPPPIPTGPSPERSRVPAPLHRGTVLPPQSVSALDSTDGLETLSVARAGVTMDGRALR